MAAATDNDCCLDDKCANAEDDALGTDASSSLLKELSESEEDDEEEEEEQEELADEEELLEDLDLEGLITTAAGLISSGGGSIDDDGWIPLFSSSCGILLALLLITFNFFLIMSIPS